MKAIILAAGKGSRLLPITLEIPKPLILIDKLPIIDHIFNALPDEVDEVIIVVDYLQQKIKSHIGTNFYNRTVSYIQQGTQRGTFGALLAVKDILGKNERFLVLNSDDIHDKKELSNHLYHPRSFGLQHMHMPNYYSVRTDLDGYIEGFFPQTDEEKLQGVLVANGVYMLDTNIFDHPGVIIADDELGLPQTLLAQKEQYPLKVVVSTHWLPINSLKDMEYAEEILKNMKRNT